MTEKSVFVRDFLKFNNQIVIIAFFVFWGFIISSGYSLFSIKEVLYVFVILFFSIALFLFIKSRDQYSEFTKVFCTQIIILSAIIGVLGLTKFYFQLRGFSLPFLEFYGTSLISDYNFYILFCFLGLVSILFGTVYFRDGIIFSNKSILSFLLLILSVNVLFSYSRRGVILLFIVLLLSSLFLLFGYRKNNNVFKVVSVYLGSFLVFMLLLFLFFKSPVTLKRAALDKIGITAKSYQYFSSTLLYRYFTIFSNLEYEYFNKKAWTEDLDPLNPDTGWNLRKSSLVFSLPGENSEIVPENSIGYKMDSTCDASVWNNNAYSYTNISGFFRGDNKIKHNDYFYASVYCYVSKDFDGTWARISTEGETTGRTICEYNLKNKGTWQKLSLCFKNKEGLSTVYLYWAKDNALDFSKLNGSVIFAFPEYKIVSADPSNPESGWGSRNSILEFPISGKNADIVPPNTIGYKMDSTCNASTWSNNAYSFTDISSLFKGDTATNIEGTFHASVYCYVSDDFDGTWANISAEGEVDGNVLADYDFGNKGTWQNLQIDFHSKSSLSPVYLYWSKFGVNSFKNLKGYIIYAYPRYYRVPMNSKMELSMSPKGMKLSPLYKSSLLDMSFLSKILSDIGYSVQQDSIIKGEADEFLSQLEGDRFSGTRTARWYYSWVIFKEYPLHNKIFGSGFDYMKKFGTEFGEVEYDYPHNPFLTAFLLSGIIGGFAYIWFMFLVFCFYIKYFRYHIYFFICFLITFYFSFFSVNTHFTIPAFAFFSIVPFLTRYLVDKEKTIMHT